MRTLTAALLGSLATALLGRYKERRLERDEMTDEEFEDWLKFKMLEFELLDRKLEAGKALVEASLALQTMPLPRRSIEEILDPNWMTR